MPDLRDRERRMLLVLCLLTVALLFYPVQLRVGMNWYEAQGQLSLVPARELRDRSQPRALVEPLHSLLPGRTYLFLWPQPVPDQEGEFRLADIRLGQPGAGVPSKSEAAGRTTSRTELDLTAYGYPRLLGFGCAAIAVFSLIRRIVARRRVAGGQPLSSGNA